MARGQHVGRVNEGTGLLSSIVSQRLPFSGDFLRDLPLDGEQAFAVTQTRDWSFRGMSLIQYVWLSYAPMSQPVVSPPPGRGRPRWSVFRRLPEKSRQPAGLPASSAGLPFSSAMVCVGPPLPCSAPSLGFSPLRSPGPAKLHVLSLLRL